MQGRNKALIFLSYSIVVIATGSTGINTVVLEQLVVQLLRLSLFLASFFTAFPPTTCMCLMVLGVIENNFIKEKRTL